MSNVLKVSKQETIQTLFEKGWSLRRIAKELGVNRRTVARYASAPDIHNDLSDKFRTLAQLAASSPSLCLVSDSCSSR